MLQIKGENDTSNNSVGKLGKTDYKVCLNFKIGKNNLFCLLSLWLLLKQQTKTMQRVCRQSRLQMNGSHHHRAPLAYKVCLCEIEKGTPRPTNANSNMCKWSLVWISAPTCSLYWASLCKAQPVQTATSSSFPP